MGYGMEAPLLLNFFGHLLVPEFCLRHSAHFLCTKLSLQYPYTPGSFGTGQEHGSS